MNDDTNDGGEGEIYCDDFSPVFVEKLNRGEVLEFLICTETETQRKKTTET